MHSTVAGAGFRHRLSYPLTHLCVGLLQFPPEKVALPPRHPLTQIHDKQKLPIHTQKKETKTNAQQEDMVLMNVRERQREPGRRRRKQRCRRTSHTNMTKLKVRNAGERSSVGFCLICDTGASVTLLKDN